MVNVVIIRTFLISSTSHVKLTIDEALKIAYFNLKQNFIKVFSNAQSLETKKTEKLLNLH